LYVITFYSFKGGVGRTMALVNVAAELVRRGRKVLVVDFDLEAPGLETYKHLQPPKPHPGIVEYIAEYRRTNAVPNLLDYIYETKPIGIKGGRLWVMPAGKRDLAYRRALSKLDWKRLYKDEEGFLLFEDTKMGWAEELKPDYVLIDSRTGDTEVLGICTRQLPDSVVLMFTPNEQNLAGLENVVRDIRREKIEGLKKEIRLHFVAANVPDLDDEHSIVRRQMDAFRKRLDFEDLSGVLRRYESLGLLDQDIMVLDRPRSRLARRYRALIQTLIRENLADRDGAMILLDCYSRRQSGGLASAAKGDLWLANFLPMIGNGHALDEIASHFPDDPEVLLQVAKCRDAEGQPARALAALDRAVQLRPEFVEARFQRARCQLYSNKSAAIDDLFACLRLPQSEPDATVRIFQELSKIAPNKLIEAVELVALNSLPDESWYWIADILGKTGDQGVSRAIELLGAHNLRVTDDLLFRGRRWSEYLKAAERWTRDSPRLPFDRLLAHWGLTGSVSVEQWSLVLKRLRNYGSRDYEAWALWGTRQVQEALACLDEAERNALRQWEPFFFSLWRHQEVTLEQYMDDSRLARRMFQGEPLRPAFLGPAPT
jgi:MinD-like ATPase involved in chromosome partitioning or flagellar assembly